MRNKLYLPLLVIFSLCWETANSQPQSVDEVIDKYIEARGGLTNILSLENVSAHGKMYRFGLIYDLRFLQKQHEVLLNYAGENEHLKRIPGKFDIKVVSNGDETWQTVDRFDGQGSILDPMLYPWIRISVECESDLQGPLIDYKTKGHEVELAGTENVEGRPAHKLAIKFADGSNEEWFIDQSTYQLSKRMIPYVNSFSGQASKVEIYYYDYKTVHGVNFAHAVLVDSGPSTIERLFEDIQVNTELDEDLFVKP